VEKLLIEAGVEKPVSVLPYGLSQDQSAADIGRIASRRDWYDGGMRFIDWRFWDSRLYGPSESEHGQADR
jgi:hypothetical protein